MTTYIFNVITLLGGLALFLSGMNLSVSDNRILNTLLYTVADIERFARYKAQYVFPEEQ